MANKEDSSFLQGVESRLDALFGEDIGPQVKDKEPNVSQPSTARPPVAEPEVDNAPEHADVAADLKEDIREIPVVKTPDFEAAADKISSPDKSAFISEIEKRFSAIFGEDDKEAGPVKPSEKPTPLSDRQTAFAADFQPEAPPTPIIPSLEKAEAQSAPFMTPQQPQGETLEPRWETAIREVPDLQLETTAVAEPPQEKKAAKEEIVSEFAAPMSSIYNSPLKDMKSIVLSIEWEISDHILEQFDEEVNKLYLFYTGNRIIQGFLRILRFLGRYIRVRGVSSNQDSINLLLSVYDHLESVMITEGMTEAKKHVILLDNIKKYRDWVQTTDLETEAAEPPRQESAVPVQTPAFDIPSMEAEPTKVVPEAKPATEPFRLELARADDVSFSPGKVDSEFETRAAEGDGPMVPPSIQSELIAAMKTMPVEEAVRFAVERIQGIYQVQIDALKEEIRVLRDRR